jgi:hypothetical protein
MEQNLQIIDPTVFTDWDGLIKDKTDYAFFNSTLWANVLKKTYAFKSCYLSIIEDNKIQFLLPLMDVKSWLTSRRVVSLPFTDFCFPIINNNNYNSIFEKIIKTCASNNWQTIEFRSNDFIQENYLSSSTYYNHKINLNENSDILFNKLKSSTKRNINKAIKEGIEVKICDSNNALIDYYRLHCKTRKKHGIPPQPFKFFKNILDCIIKEGFGKIFLAIFNNTPIAGAIYFSFGHQVIYKFGASDSKYQILRANNLVMWKAIQYFSKQGYITLFLGRTDLPNEGLRRYKKNWNADEKIIKYSIYDIQQNEFIRTKSISNTYINVFKIMPLIVLKLIGLVSYRHSG